MQAAELEENIHLTPLVELMDKEVKVEELRSLLGLFATPQEGSSATNNPNGGTQQDL